MSEKFDFFTAESELPTATGPASAPGGVASRLTQLEAGLSEIREVLQELSRNSQRTPSQSPSRDRKLPRRPSSPAPAIRPGALRGGRERKVSFVGLDPTVVDAALQAGVPETHLEQMSGLLQQRGSKMGDLPRPSSRKTVDPLSDSEEEAEELVPDGADGLAGSSSDGGVAKAIVKLTKVCSHLASQKNRKKVRPLGPLVRSWPRQRRSLRRFWIGKLKEGCCPQSSEEAADGEPQDLVREHRIQLALRLHGSTDSSWRTLGWRHSQGMAGSEISRPEFHWPCQVVLASCRYLGCSHGRPPGGSESKMRPALECSRPEFSRWWVLDLGSTGLAGGSASLPHVLLSPGPVLSRKAAHSFAGSPMVGFASPLCEGARQLPRGKTSSRKRGKEGRGEGGGQAAKESERKAESRPEGKGQGLNRRSGRRERGFGLNVSEARSLFEEHFQSDSGDAPPSFSSRSQQHNSMHIPGTKAGIYLARQCFNSCLRVILNSRCRLSRFAISALGLVHHPSDSREVAEDQKGGFPLPVPYPEALSKGWMASAVEVSRKRMINVVVIALNYTTLGRASSCPGSLRPGNRLTAVQWGIVRRLEVFLEDWLEAGEIGPDRMGRFPTVMVRFCKMHSVVEAKVPCMGALPLLDVLGGCCVPPPLIVTASGPGAPKDGPSLAEACAKCAKVFSCDGAMSS